MKKLTVMIGSFFYTGYFPFAPATFASFIWVLAFLYVPRFSLFVNPYSLILTIPLAVYTAGEMEKMFGHDSSRIVIDEFVGMQFALLMLPQDLHIAAVGFFLFRFFDIAKPFPVGRSQRLHGGFGVVVDDILAGIYARILIEVLVRFVLR